MKERSPATEAGGAGDSWLVVARVVRPRGNRGEVLAEIETDFPAERLKPGPARLRDARGRVREAAVEETWFHKDRVVIKFAEVDSISEAETLRGLEWVVPAEEALELPEGAWYRHQLSGLKVRAPGGRTVGRILTVQPAPGADLLVLEVGGEEVLVPAAREYLKEIRPEEGYLVLDLPEGLLDLNRER